MGVGGKTSWHGFSPSPSPSFPEAKLLVHLRDQETPFGRGIRRTPSPPRSAILGKVWRPQDGKGERGPADVPRLEQTQGSVGS